MKGRGGGIKRDWIIYTPGITIERSAAELRFGGGEFDILSFLELFRFGEFEMIRDVDDRHFRHVARK